MEKRCLSLGVCRDLWKRAKDRKGKSCIISPLGLKTATGDGSNREEGGFIGFMGKQIHLKVWLDRRYVPQAHGEVRLNHWERNCASAINVTATWRSKYVVIHVAQDFNKPCLVSRGWKLLSGNLFLHKLHREKESTHWKHSASLLTSFTVLETNS